VLIFLAVFYLHDKNFALLNTHGVIGDKERHLIIMATLMSLIVVIPVYVMTFYIVWKYRETNHRPKKYRPDWDHNVVIEGIWWLVPLTLITILSVITWRSSHELDPFRPIAAEQRPLTVQVIALQWKWLFIYPEQGVATVNQVVIPEDRPVDFALTADAPMNSFWIPQLGGQMYAMSGMSTHLHLLADKTGAYQGSSANISGKGFASMKFTTLVSSDSDFLKWIKAIQQANNVLNWSEYNRLALPNERPDHRIYGLVENDLYNKVIMKYMGPQR